MHLHISHHLAVMLSATSSAVDAWQCLFEGNAAPMRTTPELLREPCRSDSQLGMFLVLAVEPRRQVPLSAVSRPARYGGQMAQRQMTCCMSSKSRASDGTTRAPHEQAGVVFSADQLIQAIDMYSLDKHQIHKESDLFQGV